GRHLPRLHHRVHERLHEGAILGRRQPLGLVGLELGFRDRLAVRIEEEPSARPHAAMEAPVRQAQRHSGHAGLLQGLVPAIGSAQRCTTRSTPVSPTNMWCASSVSMNRVVRASGSNPLCANAESWYLPSRSVNIVNMKKLSQSSIGSLKVLRIRGLSPLPERRASSSSASSRPSRPKYRCSR